MRENNKIEPDDLLRVANDLHRLVVSQQSLLLATSSKDGAPEISYAPYVRNREGHFFIFISELAGHTAHLLNNPKASVMFIRPESESHNLFARERAVYACAVKEIASVDEQYARQLEALQVQFGQVMALLRSLNDFHLFELCPVTGRYIAGFGRAFTIHVHDGSVSPLPRRNG